jgi:hypothetical protein
MKVPVIEHQIYMCSACRHIARRLVFRRAEVPITHSPVIPISVDTLWKESVAAPRTWRNPVEKLGSRQIDIKERAAAVKIAGWTKASGSCGTGSLRPSNGLGAPGRKGSSKAGPGPHSLRTLAGKSRPSAFAVLRSTIDRIWSLAGGARQNPKPPVEPAFSSYKHGEDKR